MPDFHMSRDADGIALIVWDTPGKSMNVLSMGGMRELVDLVDTALADSSTKGIVITSGKDSFAGGMDLGFLAGLKSDVGSAGDSAKKIFTTTMQVHASLRKIELAGTDPGSDRPGKPVVAALTGTAVGIGYEIPLACHRIICARNATARIGLPEVKLGLFPGAGGTTRLVRRLGLEKAVPFLFEGKLLSPARALKAGLVDEVVEADQLVERARTWALENAGNAPAKPWDQKGYSIPGGGPYSREGFNTFAGVSAAINSRSKGIYPALNAMVSAIYEGALLPFDSALKAEARWFTKLLLDPSPEAMIRTLFFNKKALEKSSLNGVGESPGPFRKVGVVGAGMMGAGIAVAAARAGLDILLLDRTAELAESGKEKAIRATIRWGTSDPERKFKEAVRQLPVVTGSDYAELSDRDLVIEAVFEDPRVKAKAFQSIESVVGDDCIIASNTSSLPITDLSTALNLPERFLGMHFFSPVSRMPLVEIIKGRNSGRPAIAAAAEFAARIGKTPIIVGDARFFYANRCIIPYLNEGVRMVREGVPAALIENAAKMAGMPVGPLQLIDETSIELSLHIAQATRAALGQAYTDHDVDKVIFELGRQERLGRKARAGFYDYSSTGKRLKLWDGLASRWKLQKPTPSVELVTDRLLLVQVLEAIRTLESGVLEDARSGDVGAVLGWGFAPWSGGPFSWVDMVGAPKVVALARELEAAYGKRFRVPPLLEAKAASGQRFYDGN